MGVEEGETTCVDVASGSFAVGGGEQGKGSVVGG